MTDIVLLQVIKMMHGDRPPTKAILPTPAEPKQTGPSVPLDLRELLTSLTEVSRRQGALLESMCELLTQQSSMAPQASEPQAPQLTTSAKIPTTPAPLIITAPTASSPSEEVSREDKPLTQAEQERITRTIGPFPQI